MTARQFIRTRAGTSERTECRDIAWQPWHGAILQFRPRAQMCLRMRRATNFSAPGAALAEREIGVWEYRQSDDATIGAKDARQCEAAHISTKKDGGRWA